MNEELRLEILKNHYTNWLKTTKNPQQIRYAQVMLDAVLNGTYKEVFNELSSTAVMYQDMKTGEVYASTKEAAESRGVSPSTISINHLRYNLELVKL